MSCAEGTLAGELVRLLGVRMMGELALYKGTWSGSRRLAVFLCVSAGLPLRHHQDLHLHQNPRSWLAWPLAPAAACAERWLSHR